MPLAALHSNKDPLQYYGYSKEGIQGPSGHIQMTARGSAERKQHRTDSEDDDLDSDETNVDLPDRRMDIPGRWNGITGGG